MKEKIEKEFQRLCRIEKRKGTIGFVPLKKVRLLPVQIAYLKRNLASFDFSKPITAISIGIFYTPEEIKSIPRRWVAKGFQHKNWIKYARACAKLNKILNRIAQNLADQFGGNAAQATLSGLIHKVRRVEEYFDLCFSHRAFAEKAGIGWRGKSGLIVTPEYGSALRLCTVFVPHEIRFRKTKFKGCGNCQGCLEICPFLKSSKDYRQGCLLRLKNVGLENEVCGICIRACWERMRKKQVACRP